MVKKFWNKLICRSVYLRHYTVSKALVTVMEKGFLDKMKKDQIEQQIEGRVERSEQN